MNKHLKEGYFDVEKSLSSEGQVRPSHLCVCMRVYACVDSIMYDRVNGIVLFPLPPCSPLSLHQDKGVASTTTDPAVKHSRFAYEVFDVLAERYQQFVTEVQIGRPPGRPTANLRLDALVPLYDDNGEVTDSAVAIELDHGAHRKNTYCPQDEVDRTHDASECCVIDMLQMCRLNTGRTDHKSSKVVAKEQIYRDMFLKVVEAATNGNLTAKRSGVFVVYVGYPEYGLVSPLIPIVKEASGVCRLEFADMETVGVEKLCVVPQQFESSAVLQARRRDYVRQHLIANALKEIKRKCQSEMPTVKIVRMRDHPKIKRYLHK
eukprot:GHVU01061271.1.p1 GENE.GHVU01061271.1~~GHVU01061271.1.p1  ORF type:complete len:319 (+),score=20.77 GHVU01061271.1:1018-1974(+)